MSGKPKLGTGSAKHFAGQWAIAEMDNFDQDYFDLGDESPHLTIQARDADNVYGEYAIGLSTGSLDGALRVFGGESVVVFGYGGMDEMDPVEGGGWLRLTGPDMLEGEFVSGLGRFRAERQARSRSTKTKRRTH